MSKVSEYLVGGTELSYGFEKSSFCRKFFVMSPPVTVFPLVYSSSSQRSRYSANSNPGSHHQLIKLG